VKVSLRPYQQSAVESIRGEFGAGRKSVVFVLPCGGGKTYTFSYIAEQAALRGNRVLILQHRKELIRQSSCSLASLSVHHRVVSPADKIADLRRIQVARFGLPFIDQHANVSAASVQTLTRRLDWLQEFNPALVIADECHHVLATGWRRIIDALPRARLLGVTATPCRMDGQGLGDVFESMVLGPSMRELIDDGALVRPRVFAPPVKFSLDGVHRSGGDFNAKELSQVLDQPTITGDAVEHYRKLAPGRPAIVFCASVKHAHHVCEEFVAAGFRFKVVTGDMDDDERDAGINGLADGRIHGIVTVDIAGEGVDIPVAEVAIMLRATESESLYIQQAGRVLRPAPGKEYGLILDHVGNVLRHGMPDADRAWTLKGRQKRAKGEAKEQGPRILQCPKCYMVTEPTSTCPACGHVFDAKMLQPRQVAGELREIEVDADTIARQQARLEQGRANTLDQLKAMGMSTARAQHVLAARAEKERLQTELRDLLIKWSRNTGRGIREGWGFAMADVRDMKPKQLRETIERVGAALFDVPAMPANDNRQAGFELASEA
jgi:superfamily II DNA or RNA helicase